MQFQIPLKKSLKLFHTLIQPILTYNSENWATLTDKQIIKCKADPNQMYELSLKAPITVAQLKFFKFILGVSKQCPTTAILGEVDELPLQLTAYMNMIKYWNRLRLMKDDTLVKIAYNESLSMNTNWCKTIQALNATFKLNVSNNLQGTKLFTLAKKNITKYFHQNWKKGITNSPKLDFYEKIKPTPQLESYIDLDSFKPGRRNLFFVQIVPFLVKKDSI